MRTQARRHVIITKLITDRTLDRSFMSYTYKSWRKMGKKSQNMREYENIRIF